MPRMTGGTAGVRTKYQSLVLSVRRNKTTQTRGNITYILLVV